MAEEPKPYRVYRGGRARGKVPSPPKPARQRKSRDGGPPRYTGPGPVKRPRSRWRWLRWVGVGFVRFHGSRLTVPDDYRRVHVEQMEASIGKNGLSRLPILH